MQYSIKPLKQQIESYLTSMQVQQIMYAFEFASLAHKGQKRKSGENYIWHPVAVAKLVADLKLDKDAVICALLHDTVEDTKFSLKDIEDKFGTNITKLVDGLTKLKQLSSLSIEENQADNLRKMILAMSIDLRIIIVKLADRLHNMQTLKHMSAIKQQSIAKETMEIYAPIASRLGINNWYSELVHFSFIYLHPRIYRILSKKVNAAKGNSKKVIRQVASDLSTRLAESKLKAHVEGREKTIYSIFHKMRIKKLKFNQVYDIFGFRIIVDSVSDCYLALGIVHSLYQPIPGKFKDYIAIPKNNGYQSVHSTLFGFNGIKIEVQIRTKEMNLIAEKGVAAHWQYKDTSDSNFRNHITNEWLQNLLELQKQSGTSIDFIENIKIDLFPNFIYVFTPNGKIYRLPRGATALDFAYAVHTEVGHSAMGCYIDSIPKDLSSRLRSGQIIDIKRGKKLAPNPNWLNFVNTAKARSQIRHFLRDKSLDEAREIGISILDNYLAINNLSYKAINNKHKNLIVEKLKVKSWNDLLVDLAMGDRIPALVYEQIKNILGVKDKNKFNIFRRFIKLGDFNATVINQEEQDKRDKKYNTNNKYNKDEKLTIKGSENLNVSFSNCCTPIPGDKIVGVISAGKGLVIHREKCSNIKKLKQKPDRVINVTWHSEITDLFVCALYVEHLNVTGWIGKIAQFINACNINIESISVIDSGSKQIKSKLVVQVQSLDQLNTLIRDLQQLDTIVNIERKE